VFRVLKIVVNVNLESEAVHEDAEHPSEAIVQRISGDDGTPTGKGGSMKGDRGSGVAEFVRVSILSGIADVEQKIPAIWEGTHGRCGKPCFQCLERATVFHVPRRGELDCASLECIGKAHQSIFLW